MATEMAGADADVGIDYLFHVAGARIPASAYGGYRRGGGPRHVRDQRLQRDRAHEGGVARHARAANRGDHRGVFDGWRRPRARRAAYSATKAALAAFLHALRGETADRGVRVCVAHPGPIATGLGGQTRVVFGATLAKSTCDTEKSDVAPTERTKRKTKSGWTRGGRRRASRRARRTGWTR